MKGNKTIMFKNYEELKDFVKEVDEIEFLYMLRYLTRYGHAFLKTEQLLNKTLESRKLKGLKDIYSFEINSGKSCAIARLSVKYDIPIVVKDGFRIKIYKQLIPDSLPEYFKDKVPEVVLFENLGERDYRALLIDDMFTNEEIERYINNMNITMELIELQTYVISKNESIINDMGNYKSDEDVFELFMKLWSKAGKEERKYIRSLFIGTPYNALFD